MSNNNPLFAFFGTPDLAVYALDQLEARGFLPALVVSAPDRRVGRGMELTASPTKAWAIERGIDVATPDSLKDENFSAELRNTDWDVFIVAAYGKLMPADLLAIPKHGVLNIHPSLLPKFRGPSPILSAILADERHTGVSVMQLTEGMDEGPIVAQASVEISEDEWPLRGSVLSEMLFTEGGNLLADALPLWVEGKIDPIPQDHSGATYTKKFTDDDALLDLSGAARQNFLKIHAFDQNPRAYFLEPNGARVIVTDAEFMDNELKITRVIPAGKREIGFEEFLKSQK
jgi:methionyl-tRNA formyltransferase